MRCGALALVDDIAVPGEAVGLKGSQNQVRRACLLARWINVLNTKKPEPFMGPGLQIAGNRGNE